MKNTQTTASNDKQDNVKQNNAEQNNTKKNNAATMKKTIFKLKTQLRAGGAGGTVYNITDEGGRH